MQQHHQLLIWSLLNLSSVSGSLMSTALKQIITEVEISEFKSSGKCDQFVLGEHNFMIGSYFESLSNPVILVGKPNGATDVDVFSQLVRRNTKCLFLLMAADNKTDAQFVVTIISSRPDSVVINVVGEKRVDQLWRQQDSDMFPRNVMELNADSAQREVSVSIVCTQNMGHITLQNVNMWESNRDELPIKPLIETMPRQLCPHPLYKNKLKVGYSTIMPSIFPSKYAKYGLSGVEMSLLKLLRDKFEFELSFLKDDPGEYNITIKKWTGIFGRLIAKELDIRVGACSFRGIVDFTASFYHVEMKWVSRRPIPVPKFNQFLIVFSTSVWIATLATLLTLSVLFAFFYYIYHTRLTENNLAGYLSTPADFFLLTFTCIMEPDPVPWFPRFSAGRFLILVWSILCLNLNNFYISNLRTNLMKQNYEKEIDTSADVVQRNEKVFFNTITYNAFFKNKKIENPYLQKALSISHKRNGLFDFIALNGRFPPDARKEVFNNGAIMAADKINLYQINSNGSLGDLHVGKELIISYYVGFCPRRDTAWKADLDNSIMHIFGMGIFNHFISQELPKKSNIPATNDPTDEVKPIKFEQIVSIVFFLCIGLFIAILAFAIEFWGSLPFFQACTFLWPFEKFKSKL